MNPSLKQEEVLNGIAVVLSHTTHPGNIGAAARAMKTMGLSDLRLVNPRFFPSEVADARASGATDILQSAKVFASVPEALADCQFVVGTSARGRDFISQVLPARQAASECVAYAGREQQAAILFGTEMSGLSNEELSHCQALTYITANPNYSSLNLASAVQVLSYECRMAAELDTGYAAPSMALASGAQLEHLYQHATKTMVGLKFYNPAVPKRLLPRLRRLFARARLEQEEVDIFRGLLSSIDQTLEKLERK